MVEEKECPPTHLCIKKTASRCVVQTNHQRQCGNCSGRNSAVPKRGRFRHQHTLTTD